MLRARIPGLAEPLAVLLESCTALLQHFWRDVTGADTVPGSKIDNVVVMIEVGAIRLNCACSQLLDNESVFRKGKVNESADGLLRTNFYHQLGLAN